jgi:hypothetical protein
MKWRVVEILPLPFGQEERYLQSCASRRARPVW